MFSGVKIDLIKNIKSMKVELIYFGRNIILGEIQIDEDIIHDYIKVIDYYYGGTIDDFTINYYNCDLSYICFQNIENLKSFIIGDYNKFKNKIVDLYNEFIKYNSDYMKNKDRIIVGVVDVSDRYSDLKILLEVYEEFYKDLNIIKSGIARCPLTGCVFINHICTDSTIIMTANQTTYERYFKYDGIIGNKTILSKAIMDAIEENQDSNPQFIEYS